MWRRHRRWARKLVTVYHSNLARGLPSHLATILLFDPETGALQEAISGWALHHGSSHCGGVGGLGRKLARPIRACWRFSGRACRRAVILRRWPRARFNEVRAWSPTRANLEKFRGEPGASRWTRPKPRCVAADVIALVTASPEPVIRSEWVSDGAHVISVGATRPNQSEMDPALVRRSRLFVDSRAAAVKESGDVLGAGAEHVVAELGEPGGAVLTPRSPCLNRWAWRSKTSQQAHLAYQRAVEKGRGITL